MFLCTYCNQTDLHTHTGTEVKHSTYASSYTAIHQPHTEPLSGFEMTLDRVNDSLRMSTEQEFYKSLAKSVVSTQTLKQASFERSLMTCPCPQCKNQIEHPSIDHCQRHNCVLPCTRCQQIMQEVTTHSIYPIASYKSTTCKLHHQSIPCTQCEIDRWNKEDYQRWAAKPQEAPKKVLKNPGQCSICMWDSPDLKNLSVKGIDITVCEQCQKDVTTGWALELSPPPTPKRPTGIFTLVFWAIGISVSLTSIAHYVVGIP